MSKKIKLSRKQMKQPDAIMNWSEEAWQWLEDNYLIAGGALAGVILAIFIVKGAMSWYQLGSDAPRIGLQQAEQTMNAQVTKVSVENDPMSFLGQKDDTFRSKEEKYSAAAKSFKDVADAHPKSPEGQIALLYLGAVNEKLDKSDEAIYYYDKFLKSAYAQKAPELASAAKLGKARGLFEKKNYNAAMESINQIVGDDSPVKEQALILLARAQFQSDQPEQAKQTLAKVRADFPQSSMVLPDDFLLAYWEKNQGETIELEVPDGEASSVPSTIPELAPMEGATTDFGGPETIPEPGEMPDQTP